MYEETEKFLKFVFESGSIVELRLAMGDGMRSSRYNDMGAMARDAVDMSAAVGATYYGLNPLMPSATRIGGELNKLNSSKWKRRSAGNRDIAHRNLYLIDIDPVRESGVCSTEEERAEAFAVADQVQAYLTSNGWPDPIRVDSGNGIHLYYRGDRCNADSRAWEHALKYLADMFNTLEAGVDTTVGNASRISRLPGTWNHKGENTPERPHRMAHVISYPYQWVEVQAAQVYQLACDGGYDQIQAAKSNSAPTGIVTDESSILALIAEYPELLEMYGSPYKSGDLTIFALRECPFAGRAHRGAPGKSSIVLRPDGAAGYSCFSDECSGHTFGKLLGLLRERTGRDSEVFAPTAIQVTEDDYIRWDLDPPSAPEREEALKISPEWAYNQATWDAMTSDSFKDCPLSTDPEEWELSPNDVIQCFRSQVDLELSALEWADRENMRQGYDAILDNNDLKAMGDYLGKEWLFTLRRDGDRIVTYDELARMMAE
jgi:hypothetical protein